MKPIYFDATHPVALAVLPLKADAQARAEQSARQIVEKATAELEANGGDLRKTAPYPRGTEGGFHAKLARYQLFSRLVVRVTDGGYRQDPLYKVGGDRAVKFITEAREAAAYSYDKFICKLIGKIGETATASLSGNHVWHESRLRVVTAKGETQVWVTKTIVNQTKYGDPYLQWPSRLVHR